MKKVEAIIRPTKFEDLKRALEAAGFHSMTVTEVKGRGRQKGIVQQWRGQEYRVDMISKIKVEIIVDDDRVESLVSTIVDNTRTGNIGDGKIFIIPVDNVVRIRTGEKDGEAL
ncbi:transcriptional regulator [Methanocella sp. CWC-04]|uniref:Transcriptional regulator n=1 Tax=Methanooceanicella nereidis TaxID=2052831 RepID=A0AAP2RDF4_9EURY|nr:P-II family nitrogen regulator [Methanocella sp. CWC-04]MCD1295549.1 transcriptional regulator [Methanocella sp. CWC-04]